MAIFHTFFEKCANLWHQQYDKVLFRDKYFLNLNLSGILRVVLYLYGQKMMYYLYLITKLQLHLQIYNNSKQDA